MTHATAESELIARAKGGDRAAFDRLAAGAQSRLRVMVRRMVGHPEDTEDIIQQALLNAWRAMSGFKAEARFSTWLISIGTRLAIDHLRGQKRWRTEAQVAYANLCAGSEELSGEVMQAYATPEFAFEVREHIAYCFTCVGRSLPPDEQAALVLRDVLDLSNREAANVLGTTESVLRHRLAAARGAMTDKYESLCALVNKQGICHQCKGLREIAPADRRGGPLPDIATFADRCAAVRAISPDGGRTKHLHDVFWRRTKQIETDGIGATDPQSACGVN